MSNYYDSLNSAVDRASGYGRYGDTTLMHVNPDEVEGLGAFLGRPLTQNPVTGYPEAYWWDDLFSEDWFSQENLPWLGAGAGAVAGLALGGDFKDIAAGFGLGYMGGAGARGILGSGGTPDGEGEQKSNWARITDWIDENPGKSSALGLGALSLFGFGQVEEPKRMKPPRTWEKAYGVSPSWKTPASKRGASKRGASKRGSGLRDRRDRHGRRVSARSSRGIADPYEEERRRNRFYV